jgi:hypothetical protein
MEEQLGPMAGVLNDIREKWKAMQDEPPLKEVIMGFVNAIDWTETWIRGLLLFHVLLITLALTTRKVAPLQFVLFCLASGITYLGETLNGLGSAHWERFSKQDYFDRRGVFFTAVVSGPLLLTTLIVLVNYLITCSQLLVKAKRKELAYKAKQKGQKAEQVGKKKN